MMLALAAKDPVDAFIRANPWVFPVFFVLLWCVVGYVVSRFSGWSELAERYRAQAPFEGEVWRFQSAQMRYMMNYNNCLTFGASSEGLYLATLFLFRLGHPPLLVPWGELEIQQEKRFFFVGYTLRFRQVPGVRMWVRAKLGERIVEASRSRAGGVRLAPQIG